MIDSPPSKPAGKAFEISACLIFKDSAPYLREWLCFHLAVGFDHFYLYDNESQDDWRVIVQPFLDRGYITLVDFPGTGVQQQAYNHCLQTYGRQSKWIAFIDDDEFLYAPNSSLRNILTEFEDAGGVAVHWIQYGSAGHLQKPEANVIESYTRRQCGANPHVKCIVRPDRVEASIRVGHQFSTRGDFQILDEQRQVVSSPRPEPATAERIRINHYIIKSHEELKKRRARPRADSGQVRDRTLEEWLELDQAWSQLTDDSALQFLPEMQRILQHLDT